MSLIFKSLKKLKTPPSEPEKIKKPDSGNVYTFRKLLFSPQAVIFLFILIMIAGFFTNQGYRFFLNRFVAQEKPSGDLTVKTGNKSKASKSRAINGNTQQYKENNFPTAPDTVPITDAAPVKFTLPSTAATESSPVNAKTDTVSSLESGSSPEQSFTATFLPTPSRSDSNAKYGYRSAEPSEPLSKSSESKLSSDEKHRRDMLNHQFTMAHLVAKIEKSLAVKDFKTAEPLLRKLTAEKGEKNGYVLKLKAYLLIQKKKYQEAEDILKEILSENRTDLNAGINMAVIEARTNRRQSAYDRLNNLSNLYPERTEVQDLMARIRRP